jgi:hypothetical protein
MLTQAHPIRRLEHFRYKLKGVIEHLPRRLTACAYFYNQRMKMPLRLN